MRKKARRLARRKRAMWRFWKSLSHEQRMLKKQLKYDQFRTGVVLKAKVGLAKAELVAAMMDLNVTQKTLDGHIANMVNAKIAWKKNKINHFLKFRASLNDDQQVPFGFLMLRKWKHKKMLKWRAHRMVKRAMGFVKRKAWRMIKRWHHRGWGRKGHHGRRGKATCGGGCGKGKATCGGGKGKATCGGAKKGCKGGCGKWKAACKKGCKKILR